MPNAATIQEAIQKVNDQESFVRELLAGALDWPLGEHAASIEDVAYEWTAEELQAEGLTERVTGGKVYQIVLPNNPWGIFILDFKRPDALVSGRGMTGVLRRVLSRFIQKKRASANDPHRAVFKRENLLFICNHKYQRYRFAHFKAPREDSATAPMASFGWGPEDIHAVRTICEFNLKSLVWPDSLPQTSEQWTAAWGSAFDVEKVTKQFYKDYAAVFEKTEAVIAKQKLLKGDDLRLFTQSLFNRLMFLRFIERKEWLTFPGQQDSRYLAALIAAAGIGRRSFYKSRLHPLFFGGLAEEGKQESDAYGSVPLLNGGLFEQSDIDKKVTDLPDALFPPIIGEDGLFYRYNFTVEESTPLDIEVAVDPEMLGKVFEELVTGRHESGSYYTPRPVVSFMCREALKGHLADRTDAPEKSIARLVDDHIVEGLTDAHAQQILDALDNLKAVDPACGSGAYLLGLLQELIAIRRALQSEKLVTDPQFLYKLKLHIISNNLYGVDIDPFATEIAKLRLWLSLAVEAKKPVPLPNLDFKIETGDSLLGPCEEYVQDLRTAALHTLAEKMIAEKEEFLKARGRRKLELRESIAQKMLAISRELEHLQRRGVVDWRVQFAEVFVKHGGFNIVLANPPYVDSETMTRNSPRLRQQLSERFTTARGNWDLYVPFWQRSVDLLHPDGIATLITPNKWLSIGYGAALRHYVRGMLYQIVDYTRFRAFENVGVSSIVVSVRRCGSDSVSVLHFEDGHTLTGSYCVKGEQAARFDKWGVLLSPHLGLLTRLMADNQKLSSVCDAEEAFTVSEAYDLLNLLNEQSGETHGRFRFINTGTIDPFVSLWGIARTTYLKKRFQRPVIDRTQFERSFPRRFNQMSSEKIIISGMRHFEAFLDSDGQWIAGKSTVVLRNFRGSVTAKSLLGILNSELVRFFLRECFGSLAMDGGINFTPSSVNEIPIPQLSGQRRAAIEDVVSRILIAVKDDPQIDIADMRAELDALVYDAYALNAKDIATIDAANGGIPQRRRSIRL